MNNQGQDQNNFAFNNFNPNQNLNNQGQNFFQNNNFNPNMNMNMNGFNNGMNMNGFNGMNMNGFNNGMNMNGFNNGMNMNVAQMMQAMQSQQQKQQPTQNSGLQKKIKEMKKKQAVQAGKIFKEQKELMEKLKRNEMIRKNQKMNRKITLFFKFIRSEYDFDLLPIDFKATTKLKDVFEKYKNDSNNQNVRFMLDEQELELNDERLLGEIEEINDGEEIRVEPSS